MSFREFVALNGSAHSPELYQYIPQLKKRSEVVTSDILRDAEKSAQFLKQNYQIEVNTASHSQSATILTKQILRDQVLAQRSSSIVKQEASGQATENNMRICLRYMKGQFRQNIIEIQAIDTMLKRVGCFFP